MDDAKTITLKQLRDTLTSMLAEGVNPDTPVRMRSRNAGPEQVNPADIEDVWHAEGNVIYLDDYGV